MSWQRVAVVIIVLLLLLLGGFICHKRYGSLDWQKALPLFKAGLSGDGSDRAGNEGSGTDADAQADAAHDGVDGAPADSSTEAGGPADGGLLTPEALADTNARSDGPAFIAPPPGGAETIGKRLAALATYEDERARADSEFAESLKELGPYPSSRPLSQFLKDSRRYQERYAALKGRHQSRLQQIATAEDAQLQAIYDEANRLDAITGSSALRMQARGAIARKRAERQAAHRRMQKDLDAAGSRQGRAFKEGFQQRLAEETGRLPAAERRTALQRVRSEVDSIYGRNQDPGVRAARNYSIQWIDFFAKEPARAQKEPEKEPEKISRVDREVAAAGVRAEKKPFARVRECKDLPEASLADYREYLRSLSRTCQGAFLPDVVIDECREGNPSVDISTRCQRNIFSFLLFDSNNYVDRMRGWRHFAENCVQHRPALDLARSMLAEAGKLDSFSRQRIQAGLVRLEECR